MTPIDYHPFYCEENIWKLCNHAHLQGNKQKVIFISNKDRCCAVWHMRNAASVVDPVLWDYHVILAVHQNHHWEIWDPDSALGLPCQASLYLEQSFQPHTPPPYQPRFRVVNKEDFLRFFQSDRSHMVRKDQTAPENPPPWPVITPGVSNLMQFIDMELDFYGKVLDLDSLRLELSNID